MEDLIKTITDKVGIPEDSAKKVIDVVMNYMKDKLPNGFGDQIEGLLDGKKGGNDNLLGGITDKIGDLFGK